MEKAARVWPMVSAGFVKPKDANNTWPWLVWGPVDVPPPAEERGRREPSDPCSYRSLGGARVNPVDNATVF